MRCPQCATDNPADYRFCGMCGTPLEKTAPVSEPVSRSAAPRPESVTVPPERHVAHGCYGKCVEFHDGALQQVC